MLVGVPKEVKDQEYRVALTPEAAREVIAHGHQVLVQSTAGVGAGFADCEYAAAGARIADAAADVFAAADMIVKVKEPQATECRMLREGQTLFTYLHLAPDPKQARLLQESGCVAIAYETVTDDRGGLPLLTPMSEVAGRMAIQAGAVALQTNAGGLGALLGGVPGTLPAKVVIVGGGVVGINAARIAVGMGADVTVLDASPPRLRYLDDLYGPRLKTRYATLGAMDRLLQDAELVIGAVLLPGKAAPKLIKKDHLSRMRDGAVIVDVSIDQGGCVETARPTTHSEPTYVVDGVVHYCVANIPGAVPRTSTLALNNSTMPFILQLADKGWKQALTNDPHLRNGLNVHCGKITNVAVGESLGISVTSAEDILAL